MRVIYTILLFLVSLPVLAQTSQSVPGSITVPALLSLNVSNNTTSLNIDNLTSPKLVSGFCSINVIGNIAWEVDVSSSSANLESETGVETIPVGLISFKKNTNANYISLANKGQSIAVSENDEVQSNFDVDMKIAPLNSSFAGGVYSVIIYFTLTPQ